MGGGFDVAHLAAAVCVRKSFGLIGLITNQIRSACRSRSLPKRMQITLWLTIRIRRRNPIRSNIAVLVLIHSLLHNILSIIVLIINPFPTANRSLIRSGYLILVLLVGVPVVFVSVGQ